MSENLQPTSYHCPQIYYHRLCPFQSPDHRNAPSNSEKHNVNNSPKSRQTHIHTNNHKPQIEPKLWTKQKKLNPKNKKKTSCLPEFETSNRTKTPPIHQSVASVPRGCVGGTSIQDHKCGMAMEKGREHVHHQDRVSPSPFHWKLSLASYFF